VFFGHVGPSKASYSEITFGRWRLRQERETRLATCRPSAATSSTSNWNARKNTENLTWMATDLDRWVFLYLFAEFELHPSNSFRENRCWSHKYSFLQYDRYQTQRPKEFKECKPFQIYQSTLGFPRPMNFFETFPESSLLSTVSKKTIKRIGHHSRLRDMMGQSYPIYASTSAHHAHYLSVHLTFCGRPKHTLFK